MQISSGKKRKGEANGYTHDSGGKMKNASEQHAQNKSKFKWRRSRNGGFKGRNSHGKKKRKENSLQTRDMTITTDTKVWSRLIDQGAGGRSQQRKEGNSARH